MSQSSYAYENRRGIHPISWNDFHGLCKALAAGVAAFQPELILAVGRGGYYAGTLLAHILQVELYPIRLSRRVQDQVAFASPRWILGPPADVKDRRVLIVDEICDTGETLQLVKDKVQALRPAELKCAVLYSHQHGADLPDYIGLITDELLLNPWDREIFRGGAFQFHPEYVGALEQQGITADATLLIPAPTFQLAKG